MSTTQVKSNLAKLLATENLTVEHRNVATASFNVETRVLYLPVWDDISDDVYNLLVGHEVGHAIYTPRDYNSSESDLPQSFINVVEDARIERKMKGKYPGLVKSFYGGYKELNGRDFFEIGGINVSEMNLIDRINLYFKIGIHDVSSLIPFVSSERKFIDMVSKTETFSDVINVCEILVEYIKDVNEKKKEESISDSIDQSGCGDDSVPVKPESKYIEPDNEDDESTFEEEFFDDGSSDDMKSDTDDAWNRNTKQLISDDYKQHVYITPPSVDWDNHIETIDVFSENMDSIINEISEEKYDGREVGKYRIAQWKSSFSDFKIESKKSVSYLIKEFEMKKKADEYSRTAIDKTGVLNTDKLFSYKWSEDIFKKKSIIPTGKNHGLIMYIDWSGSMTDNLEGAVRQLINLISFCRKVNIPFRVFAFADFGHYDILDAFAPIKIDNEIMVFNSFKLVELFSSKVKNRDFDTHLFRIWVLMKCLVSRSRYASKYGLGSTPLNEAIFAAVDIFKKFKLEYKVHKVNTVFLTDGESNHITFGKKVRNHYDPDKEYIKRRCLAYNFQDAVICLKDPRTGYSDNNITKNIVWSNRGYAMTKAFLKYYKWMTRSNVVGFRLSTNSDLKYIIRAAGEVSYNNQYRKQWRNNKHFILDNLGYDELYVVHSSDDFNGEKAVINASSTDTKNKIRNQFRKYIKTKMFNKIVLSKFVAQIS